ncbi:hypothetical protein HMPREF1980_00352 [Actinomyces sp. oral taxon 172 str. F0311]|nr:hypothetical protein HMPREF1980_00352 [Actinomyces sp. oral taxon 172 str. F0311]
MLLFEYVRWIYHRVVALWSLRCTPFSIDLLLFFSKVFLTDFPLGKLGKTLTVAAEFP